MKSDKQLLEELIFYLDADIKAEMKDGSEHRAHERASVLKQILARSEFANFNALRLSMWTMKALGEIK